MNYLKDRWESKAGYKEVLVLAFPLILSTGSWSIQHFVDRMFLTWYSAETIAAVTPAGILSFTIMSLFIGTASYVSVFVAQYYGSGLFNRIGPSLWQGVYVAILAGVMNLLLIPFAGPLFGFIGHEQSIQTHEVVYFQILCLGAFPLVASSAMAGFFSGRSRPWPVMWVNAFATAVHLVMDYMLIFGKFGFPELGIKGAAIATDITVCVSFLAYLFLLAKGPYNRLYHTISGWRFDKELFFRMLRFGLPNGIQFFLDLAGFTLFVLMIGRLGTVYLASTNIVLNINTISFMPMIGFGIAISVLVGQYLGKGRADLAEKAVYSGFHMTFVSMGLLALAFMFVPGVFLMPFAAYADPASFAPIYAIALILLRFVAVYSLFDTVNIIFASAIRGAGDTHFIMYMIVIISSFVLVIPCYIVLEVLHYGIYAGWIIASTYIITLGLVFFFRFRGGKWKTMKVIEEVLPPMPPIYTETPEIEP